MSTRLPHKQTQRSNPLSPSNAQATIADQTADEDRRHRYALQRIRDQLRAQGVAASLIFDPLNIRYAIRVGWSIVYQLHNIVRWALIPVESEPVLWDSPLPHMRMRSDWRGDIRPANAWAAFGSGSLTWDRARTFAREIAGVLRERRILGDLIGVDRLDGVGFAALRDEGIHIVGTQLAFEVARSIKCEEEIQLMRQSTRVCDAAIDAIKARMRPGITEDELWATFNAAGFALGAEYCQTRLLVSGPRTNPWLQEASSRVIEEGDLVAFDTDLVGPKGYLTDVSRTYLCGDKQPSDAQRRLYGLAYEWLQEALPLYRPGVSFEDLGRTLSAKLPKQFHALRYPFVAHGTGLDDEYPAILYDGHHPGELQENMVISVEIYVGEESGRQGVKLEEQILVKGDGYEVFSRSPYDERLIPR